MLAGVNNFSNFLTAASKAVGTGAVVTPDVEVQPKVLAVVPRVAAGVVGCCGVLREVR